MLVLGIESSCDETAAAIVADGRRVLSSIVASQVDVHRVFGGVVPEVAAREHLRAVDPIVQQAFEQASVMPSDVDAIAVTAGPGLIGALLVGVGYAKGLAAASGKPLIPIDHVEAHVIGALLGIPDHVTTDDIYPALGLVVSGGHTNLFWMQSPVQFELLASSRDDACGESFDKVAKLLELGYPGGPKIEQLARDGDATNVAMPKMVEQRDRLEFSYSGLKTHVARLVQAKQAESDAARADLCAAFQEEALGLLVRKSAAAVRVKPEAKSLLVAGGVAANQRFRSLMAQELSIPVHFPKLDYCSDNAAMIAAYGFFKQQFRVQANDTWDAYSRYQAQQVTHG